MSYIRLLSEEPDTFVVGKRGIDVALHLQDMACDALLSGGTEEFDRIVQDMDAYCIREKVNPGTTADIVGAALYMALLTGGV